MSDFSGSTPQQEVPTREQIAQRAYELYEQRGYQHGRDLEDWLAAETELRSRNSFTRRTLSPRADESSTLATSRQKQQKSRAATAFNSNSSSLDNQTSSKF